MTVKATVTMPEDVNKRLIELAAEYLAAREEASILHAKQTTLQAELTKNNQKNLAFINEAKAILGNGPAQRIIACEDKLIFLNIPIAAGMLQIIVAKQSNLIGTLPAVEPIIVEKKSSRKEKKK